MKNITILHPKHTIDEALKDKNILGSQANYSI
jgi:hypothetical protein